MKRIVILTGPELRHVFFRKYMALSENIEVINCYCEGQEKSFRTLTEKDVSTNDARLKHLSARDQSEEDFFGLFIETAADQSYPVHLPKGEINSPKYTEAIINSKPDLLIAYGCSIIGEPLLTAFKGRFLNVHLGLSPYYRGSGTNYWPLVNGEPEYVGATFMYIDSGIDTGEIIHQIRAKYSWGDTPSQIGNRFIVEMSLVYRNIIVNFERLEKMSQLPIPSNEKVYKIKDYTEESVVTLYRNFESGLIERYLNEEVDRCTKVPILTNPALNME
jgi:folate-dependent phosphoribosylglycinamide formyltransferase PurN|tara:strand:- start:244 stop:1068 length:825 start_codon:yes stop_codon:yes gene_type:complete